MSKQLSVVRVFAFRLAFAVRRAFAVRSASTSRRTSAARSAPTSCPSPAMCQKFAEVFGRWLHAMCGFRQAFALTVTFAVLMASFALPKSASAALLPSAWAENELELAQQWGLLRDLYDSSSGGQVSRGSDGRPNPSSYTSGITKDTFTQIVVTMCEDLLGRSIEAADVRFDDASAPACYYKAFEAGIVNGTGMTSDGTVTLGRCDILSREQIAKMLYHAVIYCDPSQAVDSSELVAIRDNQGPETSQLMPGLPDSQSAYGMHSSQPVQGLQDLQTAHSTETTPTPQDSQVHPSAYGTQNSLVVQSIQSSQSAPSDLVAQATQSTQSTQSIQSSQVTPDVLVAQATQSTHSTQDSQVAVDVLLAFSDCETISEWARDAARYVAEKEILKGVDGCFLPKGECTFEQGVVLAKRVYERFADGQVLDNAPMMRSSLQAPVMLRPQSGAASMSIQRGVKLEWQPMAGAAGYLARIDYPGATQTQSAYTDVAEIPIQSQRDRSLTPGPLSVSIAAVDGDHNVISPFTRVCVTLYNDSDFHFDFKDAAEAATYMTTITIKVWDFDGNGQKATQTKTLTVHKWIADDVVAIFDEIYNGPEKFPIHSVFGYRPGSGGEHPKGTAVDINPNENYEVYSDGRVGVGSFWRPGSNPYSIPLDGDVVRAFRARGWGWGGTDWRSKQDYMHFSYFGT